MSTIEFVKEKFSSIYGQLDGELWLNRKVQVEKIEDELCSNFSHCEAFSKEFISLKLN